MTDDKWQMANEKQNEQPPIWHLASAIWHSQARPAPVNGSPVNFTIDRDAQNGLITGSSIGGVSDSISYNGFAEPIGYDATFNGSSLYNVSYVRDAIGRISSKTETVNGITTTLDYHYDLAGRLTGVDKNGVPSSSYTYDSNGNRLSYSGELGSFSGTYDAQDRLLSYGDFVYEYTANGELKKKTSTVTGEIQELTYDAFGNLLGVMFKDGSGVTTKTVEYVIDGRDRRVGKRVNSLLTQQFLYSSSRQVVAELDGAGNVLSRFVFSSQSVVPDYLVKAGAIYRIIVDQIGSVREVVKASTGEIVQQISYDEFGNVLSNTNPGFQPFGYAGGILDSDTNVIRFGSRDYDSQIGRFLSKDGPTTLRDEPNLYGYVMNDPINLLDPTGQASWPYPVNGHVVNDTNSPVIAQEVGPNPGDCKSNDIAPHSESYQSPLHPTESQDVDFVYANGKWYRVPPVGTVYIEQYGMISPNAREATPQELNWIQQCRKTCESSGR